MELLPTGKHILVKLDTIQTVSKGGIIMPVSTEDNLKQCRGTVIGAGVKAEEATVGDRVLMKPTYRTQFAVDNSDGTKSVIVLAEEVIAIIAGTDSVSED